MSTTPFVQSGAYRFRVIARDVDGNIGIGAPTLPQGATTVALTPESAMSTTVTSAIFNPAKELEVDADVTLDQTHVTSYHALATTYPVTDNVAIRTLTTSAANAVAAVSREVKNVIITDTLELTQDSGEKVDVAVTTDTTFDADDAKTPWILVLNYMHKGGTNPDLKVRSVRAGLPV